jgi:hypothetical protein
MTVTCMTVTGMTVTGMTVTGMVGSRSLRWQRCHQPPS